MSQAAVPPGDTVIEPLEYPTELSHPRFMVIPRPESRKLVIFFSGSGEADYRYHFYGQAQKCGANAILVNNGRNEWYQNGVPGLGADLYETIRTIQAWAAAFKVSDIYCVGASMGASGAVLYGCLLRAKVLAFGFETILNLPFSHSSRLKPKGHLYPIPDLTPVMMASSATIHAYIGMEEPIDLIASSHIGQLDNVHLTFMRRVGHGPPKYLKKRDRLDQVLAAFVGDEPLPLMPEATELPIGFVDGIKDGFYGFWTRDLARQQAGFRAAIEADPSSIIANYYLGRALISEKRFEEALPPLKIAKDGGYRQAYFYFGYAVRYAGRPQEAIELHRGTLERWPDFEEATLDLAAAHADLENYREASDLLRTLPWNHKAVARLVAYEKKIAVAEKAASTDGKEQTGGQSPADDRRSEAEI